jgi:hypothetical protein
MMRPRPRRRAWHGCASRAFGPLLGHGYDDRAWATMTKPCTVQGLLGARP